MRIPDGLLEHRCIVQERLDVPSSTGNRFADAVERECITVDRAKLVTDGRAESETRGQQILANTQVLLQPEHYAGPGSLITVWPGTPRERTLEVAATAYARHSVAPESAQAWLV